MRRTLLLGALALTGLAASCGDDSDLPSDTRAPIVDPTTATTSPTTTTDDEEADLEDVTSLDEVQVALEPVATLEEPIAMAVRPGEQERVFVAERAGLVRDLSLADGTSEVVLDITDQTTTESERGVLGIAVAPDGGHVYVSYTNDSGDSRVDEYAIAEGGGLDEGSRRVIFALDQPFPNHNGGHIAFGPDGLLYLGFGDGGNRADPLLAGQDPGQLLGSILRIDPNGSEGSAYAVPSDNPFVGVDGARPEVWLKGVRNPWRFAFDRATGDLWVADVGQDEVEEVDLLPADEDGTGAGRGANLGWNEMEGDRPFEGGVEPPDATAPIFAYTHTDTGGCSVTGGYAYRGSAIPELYGAYLFADYCAGVLTALAEDDGQLADDAAILADPITAPISFGEGPDGELYVLTQPGQLLRIVPA